MLPIFYSRHSLQPPSRLLSQDFTHLLCLLFCVWSKTKREPGQPADDVDRPSFLFFLPFAESPLLNCYYKQGGVWPRALDQSCAFWRIVLLKNTVSGLRSVCLPTFLNLFRPDNHLVFVASLGERPPSSRRRLELSLTCHPCQ